jgi:NADH:ubiquinone oxidoreductase subunit K
MIIEGIPLHHILTLSTILFFIGVFGFITRRNLFTMLMSLELLINATAINFVAFNAYLYPENLQGHFFTLFVISIAAAEAAVAIAIIVNVYRNLSTVDANQISEMKH